MALFRLSSRIVSHSFSSRTVSFSIPLNDGSFQALKSNCTPNATVFSPSHNPSMSYSPICFILNNFCNFTPFHFAENFQKLVTPWLLRCSFGRINGADNVLCYKENITTPSSHQEAAMEAMEALEEEEEGNVSDQKRTVVLGVDGGATTTISICLSCPAGQADPFVISRAVTGSSNFNSVSESTAKWALEKSMAEALKKANTARDEVKVVCLALSGVNVPEDAERFLVWLKFIFPFEHTTCYVYNDAIAALASGTAGKKYGCVLIAGTGTIAYGFSEEGKVARSSGLGPLLGDQGGGHAISTNALIAVMRAHDGRGPATRLTDAILGKLGLTSVEEILGWVYADTSWARIAALVPVVKACAKAGDEVARGVLEHAVEELACSVKAVVQTLNLNGIDNQHIFPFVMVGGVLEHEEGWDLCKPLISKISAAYPGVQVIRPNVEPAVGAALVAWRHYLEGKEGGTVGEDFCPL